MHRTSKPVKLGNQDEKIVTWAVLCKTISECHYMDVVSSSGPKYVKAREDILNNFMRIKWFLFKANMLTVSLKWFISLLFR